MSPTLFGVRVECADFVNGRWAGTGTWYYPRVIAFADKDKAQSLANLIIDKTYSDEQGNPIKITARPRRIASSSPTNSRSVVYEDVYEAFHSLNLVCEHK